jgi:hypothetical protein
LSLLFHNTKGHTKEELQMLMEHNDVQALLGSTYFGTILRWIPQSRSYWWNSHAGGIAWIPCQFHSNIQQEAYYLSSDFTYASTVLHSEITPIFFRSMDQIFSTDTRTLYTNCLDMRKFIDCKKCNNLGLPCLLNNFKAISKLSRNELEYATFYDWENRKFKYWISTLGGYTVVPSVILNANHLQPGTRNWRTFHFYQFNDLSSKREELSQRTQSGVKTRTTKRTQCSKCYFGYKDRSGHIHTCPHGPRDCIHGAWTEEELIETTYQSIAVQLKHKIYDLDTLWRIGLIAGHRFKQERQEWMVSRAQFGGTADFIKLVRTAKRKRGEIRTIESFDEIYPTLPDTLKQRLETHKKIDRRSLAIAIQASHARHACGYYCSRVGVYYTPKISFIRIEPEHSVILGVWGRTFERTHSFSITTGFDHLLSYFKTLPAFPCSYTHIQPISTIPTTPLTHP